MTIIIRIAAWLLLSMSLLSIIVAPFLIQEGKSKKVDAADVLVAMVRFALTLLIVGRVIGWW